MTQGNGKEQPKNRLGRSLGRPWPKGVSGNPKGRPPGPGMMSVMNALLDEADGKKRWGLVQATYELALKGDSTALKIIWDRTDPTTTRLDLASVSPAEVTDWLDRVEIKPKRMRTNGNGKRHLHNPNTSG